MEAQSASNALGEIEASLSGDQSAAAVASDSLVKLSSEIDAREADDTRLLAASPSLDLLYRLKATWQKFNDSLAAAEREAAQRVSSLEEKLLRLDQMGKTWQATLKSVNQPVAPPAVLKPVQSMIDSIERTRRTAESRQTEDFTLQNRISEQEARVQAELSSIVQAQNRALQNVLVRDAPPIWGRAIDVGSDFQERSGKSFASQWHAATAFIKRYPFSPLAHAVLIFLIAATVYWLRRRVRKSAQDEPDLQRAAPIFDLPVSAAFALSLLIVPSVYPQAPRLIQAVLGGAALFPTVLILRRLLEPKLFPILHALVVIYFVSQLRLLTASLPVLSRLLFLAEMLGCFVFLLWLVRSGHLMTSAAETSVRFSRAIRVISTIGLLVFPAAFLSNLLGYVNLGNLLGVFYLRSVFLAAMLYAVIRILEGLLILALHVWPLGSLRVVRLHREMLHRRTCGAFEFLAFLFWLDLTLDFLGLRAPIVDGAKAALNANLVIGSLSLSVGQVLAFLIAVWGSFLVSKFLRFVLEEDVYQHFKLARGIPYAISTMLHYAILLLGFFIGLGALGIDLTKIAILAGAFSVGIGFGLQNVINNFVSGLILLFERPIKVGDVIEVGGVGGEVRRIGIRASVIRATDGSEVIVPNGSLISGQVTNWTFSDRERAVEVSVSIARDADPQRVMELLKATAANHPGVAKAPSPQVYAVNFAASATTFQLRAWTDRYQDWAQLRSDLALAVNDALAREKIALA